MNFAARSLSISALISLVLYQDINVNAAVLNVNQAAEQAVQENLKMPEPHPDGRIQTLNKMGAMSPVLDKASKQFVERSIEPGVKVLEIGAGYGLACQRALQAGCKDYTAVDMDERHLKLMAQKLLKENPDQLNHVKLIHETFPHTKDLPSNHYDAILLARVLHFMTPEEISASLQKTYELLKTGGTVHVVLLSPYVKGYASFIPEFERRVKAGEENPGYVADKKDWADRKIIPAKSYGDLQGHFYFFDITTARRFFEKAGFIVEKCEYAPIAYKSDIWGLDGRENVILIAKKPN